MGGGSRYEQHVRTLSPKTEWPFEVPKIRNANLFVSGGELQNKCSPSSFGSQVFSAVPKPSVENNRLTVCHVRHYETSGPINLVGPILHHLRGSLAAPKPVLD